MTTRTMNKYDLTGEYGIGYTTKEEVFWFDKEDYDLIKTYHWYLSSHGYVYACSNGVHISMHKLIMVNLYNFDYATVKLVCDHINRKKVDNRKSNLRLVSYSDNNMNKELVDNGGISFSNWHNKWMSYISYENIHYHLGVFDTEEEAREAREIALLQLQEGTFEKRKCNYCKDIFIYNNKRYKLKELCRVFNLDYDAIRYRVYQKNIPISQLCNAEVERLEA